MFIHLFNAYVLRASQVAEAVPGARHMVPGVQNMVMTPALMESRGGRPHPLHTQWIINISVRVPRKPNSSDIVLYRI
jgi:hypothetical protein